MLLLQSTDIVAGWGLRRKSELTRTDIRRVGGVISDGYVWLCRASVDAEPARFDWRRRSGRIGIELDEMIATTLV